MFTWFTQPCQKSEDYSTLNDRQFDQEVLNTRIAKVGVAFQHCKFFFQFFKKHFFHIFFTFFTLIFSILFQKKR